MSHTLLILKIYTTFKDVQMMLKWFFDISTGFRFQRLVWECSVHICSCPCLDQAKLPSTLEPISLSWKGNKKRPDGLIYTNWKKGKCLNWDFTCAVTLSETYVKKASTESLYNWYNLIIFFRRHWLLFWERWLLTNNH